MLLATGLLWTLAALAGWLIHPAWLAWAVVAFLLAVWGWAVSFFRDPERPVPAEAGLFVSPADGTVTDITPVGPDSPLGCEGVRIGIFLSVFSVHVNRSPCDAEVAETRYAPGSFLDARSPQAGERNESMALHLRYASGGRVHPVVVRQVAGKIARRIVCHARAGQRLARGQRYGMIKFGSRTELLLPQGLAAEVRVRVGQPVYGAKTVLAAHSVGEKA